MTSEEIYEFFSRRDASWQRHDIAALVEDHTEDGEVESPMRGKVKGRVAIHGIYKDWFNSFRDAQYSTEHLLIDGDRAVQFVRMIGTQNGDFCGFAPTGKRFEVQCAFLFFFVGDKVAREIRLYDFAGLLLHLGVLKAKPTF